MQCLHCGELFVPTSRHHRKYCTSECTMAAHRKRYRAKPEVKARHAEYTRKRRHKKEAEKLLPNFDALVAKNGF